MGLSDDFDPDDLEELARMEGKTVDEVKRELLRERLLNSRRGSSQEPRQERAITRRVGTGDASGASIARQQHHAKDYPGSPVVRYDTDPSGETAEEAKERWLEEEAELADGVHGLGGQSAGGIFGQGPIATSVYDPESLSRGDARIGQQANIKLLGLVERLEQRLLATEQPPPRGALPGAARRRKLLGPGR